jgi:carbamoyl-phosphate synthase large subunit
MTVDQGGEFANQRMLFLPGGVWQVPVIELARHMGFHVICADGTAEPPGFAAANEGVRIPLQNIGALVELARARRINAVMTEQTDFSVPIVARIAETLSLKGLPVEVADAATNKGLMRERAQAAGLRQPKFRVCRSRQETARAAYELGLPLFHKPVDGQSSRGVGILESADAFAVGRAFARSSAASVSGAAIFEALLRGTECTCEGFVVDGKPFTLAMSDKEHYTDLPGVARTLTYPPAFPEAVSKRLAEANEAVIRAIGIPFGITHAEFMVDENGEPWLVEIAARGGGSRITSKIVPAVSGFEPVPALIRQLMGRPIEVDRLHGKASQLRFLRLPLGRRVRCYRNLEELRNRPGILEIMFHIPEGETVPGVQDDRSRHGFVISSGDDRAQAIARAEEVERDLAIEFDD